MKNIHILPPQVANRIAAGEVVERPSSVVKELVENAIDAGATAITVEIENGGIDYIRVSDNGSGIPADDCATAFLRHATSKIAAAEDISSISTLGFRGEALPSIASVSEVTLKTRTKDAESGTLLRIDNGELVDQIPYACPEGTVLEVRNLFSKTPARLKFLKNPRTEAGYIGDYLSRMIMAMPEISFVYINNGKTVYRTFGDGSLKNAVFSIYGSSVLSQLREVFYDDGYLRVTGYVGTPALARPNRLQQSLYLNGRYIRSIVLSNTVQRAYDTRLMVGKFPFFVLFLRLAGSEVDVNVHPTKMEVRFADERRVSSAVYAATVRALESQSASSEHLNIAPAETKEQIEESTVKASVFECKKTERKEIPVAVEKKIQPFMPIKAADDRKIHVEPKNTEPSSDTQRSSETAFTASLQEQTIPQIDLRTAPPATAVKVHEAAPVQVAVQQENATGFTSPAKPKAALSIPIFEITSSARKREELINSIQQEEPVRFAVEDYRLIGSVFAGYWIVEQGEMMFLIDQHAAHERKLYEELMSRRIEPSAQPLLVPEQLKLTPAEYALFEEYRDQIEAFGFVCQPNETAELELQIQSVPVIRGNTLEPKRLLEALEILNKSGDLSEKDLCRSSLIQSACKHAIKVNETISKAEIQHLLAEFADGKIPMTCPHGRPIMVQLTKLDIEKMFKRVL